MASVARPNNGLIDLWEHAAILYHGYEWQGAASAFNFLAEHVEHEELKQLCSINVSLIQARMGEYRVARNTLLDGSTSRISLALTPYILGLIEWELGHVMQAESCLNASLDLLLRNGPEDLNSHGMAFVLRVEDVRMHLDLLRESRLRTGVGEVMPVLAMRMTAERIFEAPPRPWHVQDVLREHERGNVDQNSRPYSGELLQPTVYVPPDTEASGSRRKAVDRRDPAEIQAQSPHAVYTPPARTPQRSSTRTTCAVSSLYSNDDKEDAEVQARVPHILSEAGSSAPRPEPAGQQTTVPRSPPVSDQTYRGLAEKADEAFSRAPTPSLRLISGARPKPRPRSSIISTKSMAFGSALQDARPKYVPLMEATKARGMDQTPPIGLTSMTVVSPQASKDIRQASIGLSRQPSLRERPSMQSTQASSMRHNGITADLSPFVTMTSAGRQGDSRTTASSSSPRKPSTGQTSKDLERMFIPNPALQPDAAHDSNLQAHPRFGRWTEDRELEDDWLDKLSRKIAGPPAQHRPRRDTKKRESKDSGSTASSRRGFSPTFSRFRSQSKSTPISPPLETEKKVIYSSRPLDPCKANVKTARDPRYEQEDLRLLAQFVREYDGTPFPELSRRMLARNNALDDLLYRRDFGADDDDDDDEPEPTTTDIELAIFLRNAARDRLCLDDKGNFDYRHAREDMLIGAPDPFLNGLTLRKAKKRNSAPEDLGDVRVGGAMDLPANRRHEQDLDLGLLLPRTYNPSSSLPPPPSAYRTYNPFTSSSPPTPPTISTRRSVPPTTATRRSIQMIPVPPTPHRPGAWDDLHTAASSSSSLFAGSISSAERKHRATDAALRMLEGRCRVRRDEKGDVIGRETVRGGLEEYGGQPRRLGDGGKGKRLTGGSAGYKRAVAEKERREQGIRRQQIEQQYLQRQQEYLRQQAEIQRSRLQGQEQESGSEGESVADSLTPAPLRIASSKIFGLGNWDGKKKP